MLYPLSYEGGTGSSIGVWPTIASMVEPQVRVVDDDPVIVRLLQVNFEVEGYRVLTASDGEDGLRRAQAELPDVVVLDVMMPRMNGLQVAARLRTGVRTRHIPIVLLSARAQA